MRKWLFIYTIFMTPLMGFTPWFTSTYFEWSGTNVAYGQVNLQNFVTQTLTFGTFDENGHLDSNTPTTTFLNNSFWWEFGLNKWMDVTLYGQFLYVTTAERSDTAFFGPSQLALGFQITNGNDKTWEPATRLVWFEQFPTGPYEGITQGKPYMASNNGSILSGPIFVVQKLFFANTNPTLLNFNLLGFYQSRANLQGPNTFGGDDTTDIKTHPGPVLGANIGMEVAFTPNWVFCSDINYQFTGKTTLSGTLGTESFAQPTPDSHVITLTPGIEYNFNEHIGIFSCFWITPWAINNVGLFGIIFSATGYF